MRSFPAFEQVYANYNTQNEYDGDGLYQCK